MGRSLAANTKVCVRRSERVIGERLLLARKKQNLSLRDLAAAIDNIASHETLRKYEKGLAVPDSRTLIALCKALDVTLTYVMAPQGITIGSVDFRKKSRTKAADKAAVRTEVLELLERYLQVEDILGLDHVWKAPDLGLEPSESPQYAELAAAGLREVWNLGLDPIPDLTDLLEERGLKVLFPDASIDISGLTCFVERPGREPVPVIVVNKDHTLERRRFTLAHELAHRVLDCRQLPGKAAEPLCNRFAAAFLVPEQTLKEEMGSSQRRVAYQEILLVKKLFRVSAAMVVMRLEQVGLMESNQRDWFFRTVARTWRTQEPEPLEPSPEELQECPNRRLETPTRFERLVYRALAEELISVVKAAELLRVKSTDEVELGLRGPRELDESSH